MSERSELELHANQCLGDLGKVIHAIGASDLSKGALSASSVALTEPGAEFDIPILDNRHRLRSLQRWQLRNGRRLRLQKPGQIAHWAAAIMCALAELMLGKEKATPRITMLWVARSFFAHFIDAALTLALHWMAILRLAHEADEQHDSNDKHRHKREEHERWDEFGIGHGPTFENSGLPVRQLVARANVPEAVLMQNLLTLY